MSRSEHLTRVEDKIEREENLLYEILTSSRTNTKIYNTLFSAAIKSDTFGSNAVQWAQIADAICKNYFELFKDETVIKDKFILRLAAELSEYFASQLLETRKIN